MQKNEALLLLAAWLLLNLALMSGCCTTQNAQIRTRAASRLSSCLRFNQGSSALHNACIYQSREFCRQSGLERDCGEDDLWLK
jgi:hypothetical protein